MITRVDEVLLYALKLLRKRDYTVSTLRQKLQTKFEIVSEDIVDQLVQKNFLNDRRFAENYVSRRKDRGQAMLRAELIDRGIPESLADAVLSQIEWPSLRQALAARMKIWKLRAPLQSRDAARLFRALARLGYDEDAIREEIETQTNEQQ
jgi:regulatory protein